MKSQRKPVPARRGHATRRDPLLQELRRNAEDKNYGETIFPEFWKVFFSQHCRSSKVQKLMNYKAMRMECATFTHQSRYHTGRLPVPGFATCPESETTDLSLPQIRCHYRRSVDTTVDPLSLPQIRCHYRRSVVTTADPLSLP